MANLTLDRLGKAFAGTPALQDVSLDVQDGEFVALLGPSGCGKSTLLRLIAGFEQPDTGSISIGERRVSDAKTGRVVPPEDRNIGFVFQSYALWPHMSVRRNVSYPLEVRGLSKADRRTQTDAVLAATGLTDFADRMPSDLSGGQRQRVALARCLVCDPDAVLLDEPLANLDVALRASMQDVFSDFHRRTGATMIYVTHDQAEAMAMADRIAVMSEGRIVQCDTPQMLYTRPQDRFVANFIGEGSVVPINALRQDGVDLYAQVMGTECRVASATDRPDHICLRPENISISETGDLRAKVARSTYLGGRYRLHLVTPEGTQLVVHSRDGYPEGTQLGITLSLPWAFEEPA